MKEYCKLPNFHQSSALRRFKYQFARDAGANVSWARAARDFRKYSFKRFIGLFDADAAAQVDALWQESEVL